MATDPTIRVIRATPDDAPRLAPLFDAYRVFYGKPADPAAALGFITDRLTRDESAVYLALLHEPQTRTDQAIGFVQLYPSFTSIGMRRIWTLNDLFVEPDHRNRGVGRLLMQAAEKHARETGAASLNLLTAHDNLPAQALYRDMNWTRDQKFQRWTRPLD
jgi:ribosomal protein S18 acetylase RimI-like enzyme